RLLAAQLFRSRRPHRKVARAVAAFAGGDVQLAPTAIRRPLQVGDVPLAAEREGIASVAQPFPEGDDARREAAPDRLRIADIVVDAVAAGEETAKEARARRAAVRGGRVGLG